MLCLLERFYDVNSGCITIDGVDIRRLDPRWLHRNIAIVPQEPVLFSGTIFSNITYALRAARPELPVDTEVATLAEVEAAGKQANAHDFIMTLDKINLLNTFTALEIVEYNPSLDKDFLTFNLIKDIINLCNKPPI